MLSYVEPEDILKFGMIPEFIGRFSAIPTLSALNKDELVRILTEPKNALVKQYKKFFKMEDVELEFKKDALKAIAEQAYKKKTGARALRTLIEGIMLETMYELPSKDGVATCVVTKDCVMKKTQPKFYLKKDIKKVA